jgi:hypothetical protein
MNIRERDNETPAQSNSSGTIQCNIMALARLLCTYLPTEGLEDCKRYNDVLLRNVNFCHRKKSRTGLVQKQKIWAISCSKIYTKSFVGTGAID